MVNAFAFLLECRFRKKEEELVVGVTHVYGVDRRKIRQAINYMGCMCV
jgi:hypothetical protein